MMRRNAPIARRTLLAEFRRRFGVANNGYQGHKRKGACSPCWACCSWRSLESDECSDALDRSEEIPTARPSVASPKLAGVGEFRAGFCTRFWPRHGRLSAPTVASMSRESHLAHDDTPPG